MKQFWLRNTRTLGQRMGVLLTVFTVAGISMFGLWKLLLLLLGTAISMGIVAIVAVLVIWSLGGVGS